MAARVGFMTPAQTVKARPDDVWLFTSGFWRLEHVRTALMLRQMSRLLHTACIGHMVRCPVAS